MIMDARTLNNSTRPHQRRLFNLIMCFTSNHSMHNQGKRLRPTVLLLMASALSPSPTAAQFLEIDLRPPSEHPSEVRRQLQRIAEITELIHVASLLHDDVLDESDTRRGVPALNAVFGNKVAFAVGVCIDCMFAV